MVWVGLSKMVTITHGAKVMKSCLRSQTRPPAGKKDRIPCAVLNRIVWEYQLCFRIANNRTAATATTTAAIMNEVDVFEIEEFESQENQPAANDHRHIAHRVQLPQSCSGASFCRQFHTHGRCHWQEQVHPHAVQEQEAHDHRITCRNRAHQQHAGSIYTTAPGCPSCGCQGTTPALPQTSLKNPDLRAGSPGRSVETRLVSMYR